MAATAARGTPPPELRNLRISAKQIRRLRKDVGRARSRAAARCCPGLDPRRADLVVAGAVLLDTILRRLGAEELTLCDLALREGLVLDYIRRNKRQIAQVDTHPGRAAPQHASSWPSAATTTRRTRSRSPGWRWRSSTRRARIHGLTDREREWLEYAALMHDIGVHISFSGHHRHSYYLIKNGDLRGFQPGRNRGDGARRPLPPPRHAARSRTTNTPGCRRRCAGPCGLLASILRVAESLDRSHAQVISGLEVRDRGEDIVLSLQRRATPSSRSGRRAAT